jgi:DNA-binding transcriptional ArsR family regulator
MNAESAELGVSRVAAALAEPARAKMLCQLLDGHARTATELAAIGDVTPSTASAHLARLRERQLVEMVAQGKHRYYRLGSPRAAAAIEALMGLARGEGAEWKPRSPPALAVARTCYDHMAGALAVSLHDRLLDRACLEITAGGRSYELTAFGTKRLEDAGIDVAGARALRRRFAYPCLDWSERRPHVGGGLGAAILAAALRRRWVSRDPDSRALDVTRLGRRELRARFHVPA